MLVATEKLAMTMTGLQILGRMCSKRMRQLPLAGSARREHELLLLHRQHLAADDAAVLDPAGQPEDEDHLVQAAAEDGHDRESEQDRREGELDVGDAHDRRRRPAAEDSPETSPSNEADRAGDQRRPTARRQRDPRAVDDAAVDVAPERFRAEPDTVGRPEFDEARRLQPLDEVDRGGIVRRDQRRGDGGEDDQGEDERARQAAILLRRSRGRNWLRASPAGASMSRRGHQTSRVRSWALRQSAIADARIDPAHRSGRSSRFTPAKISASMITPACTT